ncbi:endonuclease/exonuclease/phosphatase family protein [Dactylosporangium matsuzakiense]|uniref:Endonuclease n=1 Tax=Dactylosporangium matsuzakiense TaxID=53360 RepID=A0A9W6KVJ0_9ACTN|nr:endonuclease/exonuclease/phosphatase family protein [Dactylosporangium matsuzakiense]GLL07987.1 endonuclease [Dactylosporangium matsuzakiense]
MTVVAWTLAAPVAVFTVIRVLGLERGTPLVQLVTYTPYAALLSLPAGAAAAFAAPGPGLVLLGCGLVLAGVVVPRLIPRPAPGDGVRLRVMCANLLYGRGATQAFVDQLKVDDVDVLAVQELTDEGLAVLDAAGIDALLPYRVLATAPGGGGSGLFSRHPITGPVIRTHTPIPLKQTGATVLVPGAGPILVESAHPYPPRPGHVAAWHCNIRAQAVPDPHGPPRILLGDFNATLDHRVLRELLRAGYRDAAAERGLGLVPTWPCRTETLPFWTPPVTLDHVLADRRIGVREFATRHPGESDHNVVVAELVLPPA